LLDEIDKKIYLEEIVKNEKLFNKFDEKLDMNETVTLPPYISQSLAKSTNSRSALIKKAAAHINIHAMGEKGNIFLLIPINIKLMYSYINVIILVFQLCAPI